MRTGLVGTSNGGFYRLTRRSLALAALALGWLLVPATALAEPQASATWKPVPSWVQELAPDLTTPVDPSVVHDGVYDLLYDARIRLSAGEVERYNRHVEEATNQAGVDALGQVEIEYSPHYQKLLLHRAALIRDGRVLDQTGHASLRLIEQERDSAQRMYHGTVSALLVLSDVRPGDVVDVAYSLVGANPVLEGRFSGDLFLGTNANTRHVHVEVQSQAGRPPLYYRVHGSAPAPSDVEIAGNRVLTWDLKDVRPRPEEDRIPHDVAIPAELELSELANWAEVAGWAVKLFPPAPSPALTEKARELRATSKDLSGAVLAAIRFVQDDVRYLSVSLGQHSVQPHPPAAVLAQRFGDCKDKSYLLVELLRELGVTAHVALADTDLRGYLRDDLPRAFAFDHAITALDFEGKRRYIDATWAHQGGTLDTVAPPDLGAVLVVAPETTALSDVPVPAPTEPPTVIASEYHVSSTGSATLTVRSTYRGEQADSQRSEVATRSLADLSHDFLNFYERSFPGVTPAQPLDIKDDRDADVITVTESYALPNFWRDGERRIDPDAIWGYLEPPKAERRETPLSLHYPVWIRETERIELPFLPELDAAEKTLTDGVIELRRHVAIEGSAVATTYEYKSLAEAVPLAGIAKHLQILAQARHEVGVGLHDENDNQNGSASTDDSAAPSARRLPPGPPSYWLLIELGAGLVVGVGALIYFSRGKRRKKKFLARRDGERGDLPAKPAIVASLAEAREVLTRAPCSCGAPLPGTAVTFAELWFEGEPLGAGRVTCENCGDTRRGYYRLTNTEGDEPEAAREDDALEGDPEA